MVLKNNFLNLMNIFCAGKIMENVKNHRDINFVTVETRRKYLESKPNYHITFFLSKNILAVEMEK